MAGKREGSQASSIAARYRAIERQVSEACARVGRDPKEVRIVAVSKTVGLDEVDEAIAAGIHDFGENRARPFGQRMETFPGERWHYIGKLQTNKLREVVGSSVLIHSVDSLHLLESIQVRSAVRKAHQKVLLEVNVSGEESKSGFAPDDVLQVLEAALEMPNVEVQGFMTMAPQGAADTSRETFSSLRELRDSLISRVEGKLPLKELSMGMSEDFIVAVEEGSTIVRVGRSIFDPSFPFEG